jgi:hypothetical protein
MEQFSNHFIAEVRKGSGLFAATNQHRFLSAFCHVLFITAETICNKADKAANA